MKRLLLFSAMAFFAVISNAQFDTLSVETFYVDDGTITGYPVGHTTYRLWAHVTDSTDFVSSVSGVGDTPALIATTTNFWHSTGGALTGDAINAAFFPLAPQLVYDSFVTIGRTDSGDGQTGAIQAVDSDGLFAAFDPLNGTTGGNLNLNGINGGLYFALNGSSCGVAGPDLKVLIGQFTTTGDIYGYVNVQVFIGGNGANQGNGDHALFSSVPGATFGCTDPTASNYDSTADFDDGSCILPCALQPMNIMVTNPTCSGNLNGSISLTSTGGQGNVNYSINGGTPGLVGQFNNLGNGDYIVTLEDNECVVDTTITVNTDAISIDALATSITCNGDDNGTVTGTAMGGTGTLLFGLTNVIGEQTATEINFTDLSAAMYTVYAHDDNGCTGSSSAVQVIEPSALNVVLVSSTDPSCNGDTDGEIVVSGAGGTQVAGYMFSSNGVDFDSADTFSDLGADDYTIYVMDDNDCQAMSGTISLMDPEEVMLEFTITNNLCNGDEMASVEAMATGGNGGFEYSFDGGAFGAMDMWTDLAAGDYTVVAMDMNGCEGEDVASIMDPAAVGYTADVMNISCNGEVDGSISFDGTGGVGAYMYNFNDAGFSSDADYVDLAADSYTIVVQDENGCEASGSEEITEPATLSIDMVEMTEAPTEVDGCTATATVSGGTGDITIEWELNGEVVATGASVDGLEPGTYAILAEDENGCTATYGMDVDCTVGIMDLSDRIKFEVLPNPTNGIFRMNVEGLQNESMYYTILDASGRLVYDRQLNNNGGEYSEVIDITNLADGLYYLRLTVGDYSKTTKVVKNN